MNCLKILSSSSSGKLLAVATSVTVATIIQFALLWARLRGRITHYTGDRFTAKIMYRQYGLVIRDFPKPTRNAEVTAVFR